jgi:PAS domain S-box-containing protein
MKIATAPPPVLPRREGHLRLVIDTIPTMAWSLLPDGAVDFVNQRWLEYTGMSLEEAVEESIRIVHPDDLSRAVEKWLADMAAGRPGEDEMRLRRADGEYRWFLVRTVPLRNEKGHIVKWYGTSTDIEDRKRAADALHESEEKFRQIAENIREVFWMTTPAMEELLYVSPAYENIWGRSLESLRHRPRSFMDAICDEDRDEVAGIIEGRRKEGIEVEYRIVRPDGSMRWIRDRGFPVRDESGKVYRIAGIAEDITERRLADEAIRVTAKKLQALTRRLVELQEKERREIARELHDQVGQTLTAMRIDMDLIGTRLDERDDPLIRARNDDCLQLIESVFKAVGNLMYELRPPMLDDYGLVASLQWYAQQFTARTSIRAEIRGVEGWRCCPEVEITLFRIAQEALNNVARHSQAKNVRIELRGTVEEAVLTIEDDGRGFDPDRVKKTGYGLATMRERAKAVGGTFEASSEERRGTRITVKLQPWL